MDGKILINAFRVSVLYDSVLEGKRERGYFLIFLSFLLDFFEKRNILMEYKRWRGSSVGRATD